MNEIVTIAVPTHNRSRPLRETLESVAAQELPAGVTAECLIVDNNSTDDTAAVADRFAASAPMPTRRVFEPRQGSSYARNRAVDEARGGVILFIDDDAVAEPRWALELIAAMESRRLDAVCGMVLPRWITPPPPWLGPSLQVKLAVHNEPELRAAPPDSLDSIHNYFSANVGFRRETFARFGRFREELGVVGGNPMSGEDTELFERIMREGGAMGFAPAARVHHLIPPERMTRAYLRRKSYAFGRGSAIAGGRTHNHPDKLARNAIRMAIALMRGERERAIYHELECANFFGYWRGRLALRSAR
ncbi:MAG: glycosyltransferase, partial [Candidatus Binataceae bacterium]